MTDNNTKQQILQIGSDLFAKFGYDGTSIRQIAQAANVNVAAVNYHFGGKTNLYWEIYFSAREELYEKIRVHAIKKPSTKDLAWDIYQTMIGHSEQLRNVFKLMLTEGLPEPSKELKARCARGQVGPPGGEFLLQAIERDLGTSVKPEYQFWAVKMIFSVLVHSCLIQKTAYFKAIGETVCSQLLTEDGQKSSIHDLVEAIINLLKSKHSTN